MFHCGLPSFYITINPANIYNPIVKFLSGSEFDLDDMVPNDIPNYWEQASLITRNPFIAAKFFDTFILAFIKGILAYMNKDSLADPGILGVTKGYYGCIEAQGHGSLHCHMLVWIEGALNPQQIKYCILHDKDHALQDHILQFLDDTIMN